MLRQGCCSFSFPSMTIVGRKAGALPEGGRWGWWLQWRWGIPTHGRQEKDEARMRSQKTSPREVSPKHSFLPCPCSPPRIKRNLAEQPFLDKFWILGHKVASVQGLRKVAAGNACTAVAWALHEADATVTPFAHAAVALIAQELDDWQQQQQQQQERRRQALAAVGATLQLCGQKLAGEDALLGDGPDAWRLLLAAVDAECLVQSGGEFAQLDIGVHGGM